PVREKIMKLSAQLAQAKRQKQARQPAPGAVGPRRGPARPRRWALLALCLVLAGGAAWAAREVFVWTRVPAALVGQWEVTEGPMAGGTFAFTRDGLLAIHAEGQGKDYTVKASVAVEGKTLRMTTQDSLSRQEQTRMSTIRELTATS